MLCNVTTFSCFARWRCVVFRNLCYMMCHLVLSSVLQLGLHIHLTWILVYFVFRAESTGRITVIRIKRNMQLLASRVDHRRYRCTTISNSSTSQGPRNPWRSCASLFDRDIVVVFACFAFLQREIFERERDIRAYGYDYNPFTCQFCRVVLSFWKTWAFYCAFALVQTLHSITRWKYKIVYCLYARDSTTVYTNEKASINEPRHLI